MKKYLLIILLVGIVLISGCAKQKVSIWELPPSLFEELPSQNFRGMYFNFTKQPIVNEPVDLVLSLKPKESLNVSVKVIFWTRDKIAIIDEHTIDNETGMQTKEWETNLNKQEFKEFKTKIKFLDTEDWCGSIAARIEVNGLYYGTLKLLIKLENQEIDVRTGSSPEYIQKCKEIRSKTAQIPDKESCEALGGRWERISPRLEEYCNLPTTDAGKECSDSSECESFCIAELLNLTKEDRLKLAQGTFETKGRCHEWKIIVGCYSDVRNGIAQPAVCVD
ncbi:hypothetical protein DRJ17_02185 [Candidatus Woesearchaeota archaeon]|nr:MAG: hypothetical protein DRJ17_02185 [Candidatus Woesearchaeota archaeon]